MNYNKADFEISIGKSKELPESNIPEICFSGRSNVGKSTLINKLLGRKSLARVSTKPGKTVTINFYTVDNVHFTDLPGYGFARVSQSEKVRWSGLMEGYFNSGRNIPLVLQLIDMRHTPSEDDYGMLHFLCQTGYAFAVVLTKSDKLNVGERAKRDEAIKTELEFLPKGTPIIPFSATNGEGVDTLRGMIDEISENAKKG